MNDRSSRPHNSPRRTAKPIERAIIQLRRKRLCGSHIAKCVGVSSATVSRVLRRNGLSRMRDLEPREPERRYEYEAAGDMIHLDTSQHLLRNCLPVSD